MSLASVQKVYDTYARFYDSVFGLIFHQGRKHATDIINKNTQKNGSVLELGVGTGLSLPMYRSDLKIMGIDISQKMLDKAEKQVIKHHLQENVTLKVMDAAHLEVPDQSFDFVVAMYVASVVPDPDAFFKEINRVCKPNGEIIFLNHFASDKPALRYLEKKFAYFDKLVGFNSNFSIDTVLDSTYFKIINSYDANLFGYWKLVHCCLAS